MSGITDAVEIVGCHSRLAKTGMTIEAQEQIHGAAHRRARRP